MQASISFDRAADYYDQTRGFPPEAGEKIASSLGKWLDPVAPILDLGTGTGRVALHLLNHGFHLTGLDISPRMLQKFIKKALPAHPPLVLGDAHTLPFPDGSFPTVLSVQLLHLVEDWQNVIQEARRVMSVHGSFVLGYSIQTDDSTPDFTVSMRMNQEIKARGVQRRKDFLEQYAQVHQALIDSGTSYEEIQAATWIKHNSVTHLLDFLKQQVTSHSWSIPDHDYFLALEATRAWALEKYPEPDQLFEVPHRFSWQRYQW